MKTYLAIEGVQMMTYAQREAERAIEWAAAAKLELAEKYEITEGRIVWMGGRLFTVCLPGGREVQEYT